MKSRVLIIIIITIIIVTFLIFSSLLENYLNTVIDMPNNPYYDRTFFEYFFDFISFLFSDDAPYASYCTKNGGVWSYQFENCIGLSDKATCEFASGENICMSNLQSGQDGTYMCIEVCQFN